MAEMLLPLFSFVMKHVFCYKNMCWGALFIISACGGYMLPFFVFHKKNCSQSILNVTYIFVYKNRLRRRCCYLFYTFYKKRTVEWPQKLKRFRFRMKNLPTRKQKKRFNNKLFKSSFWTN